MKIQYLYLDRGSWLHRMDPRPKFALFGAVCVMSAVWKVQLLPLACATIAILILAWASKTLGNLRIVVFITVMFWITGTLSWVLTTRAGEPVFWYITDLGIYTAISAGFRGTIAVLASIVVLSSTRNEEISAGLRTMRLPMRIVFAFSTALRLAPTLMGSAQTVMDAQRARGLDLDSGNVLQRIKRRLPVIAPTFLMAMRGTDQMAMAIESRGFGSAGKPSSYMSLSFKWSDWFALAISIGLAVFAILVASNGWFASY